MTPYLHIACSYKFADIQNTLSNLSTLTQQLTICKLSAWDADGSGLPTSRNKGRDLWDFQRSKYWNGDDLWHAPYKLQFFTRLCFMTLQVSQVKHGALKSHCLSIRQAMLIEEQTNRENTFSFPRLYSCMKRFNYHDLDFYNYSEFLKAAILLRNHHHHNAAPVLIWLFNRLENDLINKSDHYQDHSTWTILYTGRKL